MGNGAAFFGQDPEHGVVGRFFRQSCISVSKKNHQGRGNVAFFDFLEQGLEICPATTLELHGDIVWVELLEELDGSVTMSNVAPEFRVGVDNVDHFGDELLVKTPN